MTRPKAELVTGVKYKVRKYKSREALERGQAYEVIVKKIKGIKKEAGNNGVKIN